MINSFVITLNVPFRVKREMELFDSIISSVSTSNVLVSVLFCVVNTWLTKGKEEEVEIFMTRFMLSWEGVHCQILGSEITETFT